jgi:hypothetical protein
LIGPSRSIGTKRCSKRSSHRSQDLSFLCNVSRREDFPAGVEPVLTETRPDEPKGGKDGEDDRAFTGGPEVANAGGGIRQRRRRKTAGEEAEYETNVRRDTGVYLMMPKEKTCRMLLRLAIETQDAAPTSSKANAAKETR